MTSRNLHETSSNLLQKNMCLIACTPPSPSTSLERFLRASQDAVSQASVLILPPIKLNLQLSHGASFFNISSQLSCESGAIWPQKAAGLVHTPKAETAPSSGSDLQEVHQQRQCSKSLPTSHPEWHCAHWSLITCSQFTLVCSRHSRSNRKK